MQACLVRSRAFPPSPPAAAASPTTPLCWQHNQLPKSLLNRVSLTHADAVEMSQSQLALTQHHLLYLTDRLVCASRPAAPEAYAALVVVRGAAVPARGGERRRHPSLGAPLHGLHQGQEAVLRRRGARCAVAACSWGARSLEPPAVHGCEARLHRPQALRASRTAWRSTEPTRASRPTARSRCGGARSPTGARSRHMQGHEQRPSSARA